MNAPIRPAPAAASLASGALLPEFAISGGGEGGFNTLLEDRLLPRSEPRKEGKKPAESDLKSSGSEQADSTLAPFLPQAWSPLMNETLVPVQAMAGANVNPDASAALVQPDPKPADPAPGVETGTGAQPQVKPAQEAKPAGEGAMPEGFEPVDLAEAKEILAQLGLDEAPKTPLNRQKHAGMPAAQQEPMLSRSPKQNEIADGPEQILPGSGSFRAAPILEVDFRPSPVVTVPFNHPAIGAEGGGEQSGFVVVPAAFNEGMATAEVMDVAAVAEPDIPLLESIREHVQSLRVSGEHSLEVSLTPDAHTELHLRVEKIDGEICVRLRLERGDLIGFESQWTQLQQALAGQGIRLEHMTGGSGNGSEQQQQPKSQPEENLRGDESGARQNLKQAANSRQARTANPSVEGWQSWA